MTVINVDKNGNIISDLSEVVVPVETELEILHILNPNLTFEGSEPA